MLKHKYVVQPLRVMGMQSFTGYSDMGKMASRQEIEEYLWTLCSNDLKLLRHLFSETAF